MIINLLINCTPTPSLNSLSLFACRWPHDQHEVLVLAQQTGPLLQNVRGVRQVSRQRPEVSTICNSSLNDLNLLENNVHLESARLIIKGNDNTRPQVLEISMENMLVWIYLILFDYLWLTGILVYIQVYLWIEFFYNSIRDKRIFSENIFCVPRRSSKKSIRHFLTLNGNLTKVCGVHERANGLTGCSFGQSFGRGV